MSVITDTIMEEALTRLKGELDLKLNTTAYTSSLNTYPNIYCWGDSFTEGVGGYVMQPDGHNAYMAYSYPAWLGQNYKALNLGARNMGMNSLRAVQGADPMVIQTSFTIPASKDTPVKIGTCTQILDENNGTGFTSRAGNLIKLNKQVETAGLNPCVINGVEGIIYREIDSNYISNEASYDYYFKRLESGEITTVLAQTEVQTYAMRNYRNGVGIFWIGANGGYTSNEDYVEKMESMIKYGDYLNYLIIAGTELNDTLIGLLKTKFTDNQGFCHVIVLAEQLPYRGYALAGISHQSVDTTGWTTTNVIKKAVPLLFEYISGQSGENMFGMHFSAWGYKAIAKLIEEKLGEMHLVCTNEVVQDNKDQYGTLLYKSGKRVLDASTYVDTHVKLYDDASKNWTFVIKWHGQVTSSSYPETIFCCMKDGGSNKGLMYRYHTEGQYHLVVGSGVFAGYSDAEHNLYVKQHEENIIIIAKNGDNYDIYVNSPNKAYGATLGYGITDADETELTCILGGRWNSAGTAVTIPTGFILDDCRIYDDTLTSIDIQTLYNELKYPPSEILATTTGAGLMSAADKTKLDSLNGSLYAPIASPTFTTSITLGNRTTSTIGTNSITAGTDNVATSDGNLVHGVTCSAGSPGCYAGGYYAQSSNYGSHAEGVGSHATGYASHGEGNNGYATGNSAHAEGYNTNASGDYSHAEGNYTTAASASQHVSGKFNVTDDQTTYAEIIGNGTDANTKSNARTLDWSGNERLKGNLYVGCNADSSGGSQVATVSALPSTMTGATSSAAGTGGLVPAPSAGDEDKFLAGDGTYKSGGLPMVILSYGTSTWSDFINAYNNNVIVYCRASSNSNPATGSQTRMAFMAYVNNATTPTNVEFQYYRSVNPNSKSISQMGDQVFIYKLDKTSGWSVTTREASIKTIVFDAATGLTGSFDSSTGTLTISLASS